MPSAPFSAEVTSEKVATASDEDSLVIDSVTLARLIEEVRTKEATVDRSYNRTYNRHNR
jgi:hypothetical protein